MGIREAMEKRRAVRSVDVAIPALGEGVAIKVKRLSTKRFMEVCKLPQSGLQIVLEAAMDEQGVALYGDLVEVQSEDWAVTEALIDACAEVNSLQVDAAGKK